MNVGIRITGAAIVATLLAGLTGCQSLQNTFPENRTATGAVAGTALGAGVGAAVDEDKRWRGALIGAAVGSLAGAGVGHVLDRQKEQLERIEELEVQEETVQFPNGDGPVPALKVNMPGELLFAHDSAELSPQGRTTVTEVAQVLRQEPGTEIMIRGYTSSDGDESYNLTLSQRRADAVKLEFMQNGISSSRLFSVGLGESNPISSNTTPEGRAMNRRVELHIVETV